MWTVAQSSDDWAWAALMIAGLLFIATVVLAFRIRASLRRATAQFDRQMQGLMVRQSELEAVLASMVEGVLAIDRQYQLMSLNTAAAKLLDIDPDTAINKPLGEVVDHEGLRQLIAQTLSSDKPVQFDIELLDGDASDNRPAASPHIFQAQGSTLRDTSGKKIGALVVLRDVTRLRRLETIRRDFVANASHEIKTPVAAIKASAETLIDDEYLSDEQRQRFMQIIVRQAERLHAIVEDLLSLARIEAEQAVALEPASIREVLDVAIETCEGAALSRSMILHCDCPNDLRAPVNSLLLEQAVVNLLTNAIKYSPDGACVCVAAEKQNGEVVISVTDTGVGIAPEHLPRLFERFYRTDKARSRALGGTGLGLSIVKHIANVHRGRVTVDSTLGKGSTFRIHIPAN